MNMRPAVSCCNSTLSGNTTMDTIYPEPMSLLHRRVVPKKRRGKANRYRTQPVTFSEIQEVDEDNLEDVTEPAAVVSSHSEQNLNRKFEEFIKRREKILEQIDKPPLAVVDENFNGNAMPITKNVPMSCPCTTAAPTAVAITQTSRFTPRPSI